MSRWSRADEVLWRRTVDAVVAIAPGQHEPVALTGTGALLWQLLAEPVEVSVLATDLAAAFGASVERVTADITPMLEELERRRLVRFEP